MNFCPNVSLVIPFHNDLDRLLNRLDIVISYLEKQDYKYEVILVDDGSTQDRTQEIQARFSEIQVIRYEKNMGKGYAVRKGILAAKGEYRFFTDADIPFGMEPIGVALKYMEEKEFDLVIGDRQAPGSVYSVHQTPLRKIASRIFTSFIGRIVITGVQDTQCGFKGFKADIAEKIFTRSRINGFSFDVEIVYISFKHNFDLKRIPVKLEHSRDSTMRMSKDSWKMLWDVFRIKWNHIRAYYQ